MRLDIHLEQIFRYLFCEFDGHHGHENPLILLNTAIDFAEQVIDLSFRRPNLDLWIEQTGRSNLHPHGFGQISENFLHRESSYFLVYI